MDNTAFQEANLRLIKEVEKRPTLYDKTLLSYTRKSAQNQAWNEIAKILGWDVASCRDRWRNLRCVYIRHVRKMSMGKKTRPYYLMNALRFVKPFLNIRLSKSQSEENNEELDKDEDNDRSDEDNNGNGEDSEENNGNDEYNTGNDEDNMNSIDENNSGEDKEKQELIVLKDLGVSSPLQHNLSRPISPDPIRTLETSYLLSPDTHYDIKVEDCSQSLDFNMSRSRSQHNEPMALQCFKNKRRSPNVQEDVSDLTPPTLDLHNDARKMFLLSLLPDVYEMNDAQMRTFKRGVINIIGNIFDSGNSMQ